MKSKYVRIVLQMFSKEDHLPVLLYRVYSTHLQSNYKINVRITHSFNHWTDILHYMKMIYQLVVCLPNTRCLYDLWFSLKTNLHNINLNPATSFI